MAELDFLAYVADDLPATRTYGRRSYLWVPVYEVGTDNLLGRLTLKMQHAKSGVHRALEIDTYLIERDSPEPGDDGPAYWIHNQSDPKARVYRCVMGRVPLCDCKAGTCRVPADDCTSGCKHRDVLRVLTEAGKLGADDSTLSPEEIVAEVASSMAVV